MAAAAPRLSDYEEFKDYEREKSDFDKDIIRVERVIAQLIQKKDTPEHMPCIIGLLIIIMKVL
jgi:hypothetical protein